MKYVMSHFVFASEVLSASSSATWDRFPLYLRATAWDSSDVSCVVSSIEIQHV